MYAKRVVLVAATVSVVDVSGDTLCTGHAQLGEAARLASTHLVQQTLA